MKTNLHQQRNILPLSCSLLACLALTWDANTSASGPQDGSGTWGGSQTNWWSGPGNVAWADNSAAVHGPHHAWWRCDAVGRDGDGG